MMPGKAPERIGTNRLVLRRPRAADAEAVYRYACDAEVVRYVGWPRHRSLDDTRAFLGFSDAEWERWPAGPYTICLRGSDTPIGGTGLAFETGYRAMTGYVLSREVWGLGFATEALTAVVALAPSLGVCRLYALCHVEHAPSARVLEKCGFEREAVLRRYAEFPNLAPGVPDDVLCYARILACP
jgi:RimJ/RimL family protein N-acetyltransferase